MRTALLAALLLQLLIQVEDGSADVIQVKESEADGPEKSQFKYGDIIGFERERLPVVKMRYRFMHFGIYIDKLRFEEYGQKEGDNLFHITGPIKGTKTFADCVFGKIEDEARKTVKVFNYLDGIENQIKKVRLRSEDAITERILCKLHNCQQYHPLHDNCEHLATYVRYGVPICLQLGQTREGRCHNKRHGLTAEEEKKIIDLLREGYDGSKNQMADDYDEGSTHAEQ